MEKILIVDDSLLQATQLKAIIDDEYDAVSYTHLTLPTIYSV